MTDKKMDIQSARNLFSKAEKVVLGVSNIREIRINSVGLFFRARDAKQVHAVFAGLSTALKNEPLRLSIIENNGDYLTLSFLWVSKSIIFAASPDQYSKKECKNFRSKVFYEDEVKVFFFISYDDHDETVITKIGSRSIMYMDAVYYEYIP